MYEYVRDILETKNIPYKESGGDFVVRCFSPDHEDRNPSLRIDKITGLYNCLSCGYSGCLLTLGKSSAKRNLKVKNLLDKIQSKVFKKLSIPRSSNPVYYSFREISADTFLHFEAFEDYINKDFEDRIVIPIRDIQGNILAFQGRHRFKNDKTKYMTVPTGVKMPIFPAIPDTSDEYNYSVILVEGMFDMLNLYDKGLKNAICNFGCSPRKDHKEELDRFINLKYLGIDTIYIMFDGDNAGKSGSKKYLEILKQSFNVDTIELDEGVDPGSLTKQGINQLKKALYEDSTSGEESIYY